MCVTSKSFEVSQLNLKLKLLQVVCFTLVSSASAPRSIKRSMTRRFGQHRARASLRHLIVSGRSKRNRVIIYIVSSRSSRKTSSRKSGRSSKSCSSNRSSSGGSSNLLPLFSYCNLFYSQSQWIAKTNKLQTLKKQEHQKYNV